jgi:hypothetical protein
MKIYTPAKISANSSSKDIAKSINNGNGILLLTDLPKAPFTEIQAALDGFHARPDLVTRLNEAYKANLVYKSCIQGLLCQWQWWHFRGHEMCP